MKMRGMMAGALAAMLLATAGWAQEAEKSEAKPEGKREVRRDESSYKLDFSIIEINDGKRVNARQYTTNITSESGMRDLRFGTRVPVEVTQGQFNYMDVGTSILTRLREAGGDVMVDVTVELSNFALPEEAQSEAQRRQPVVRQLKFGGAALVPLGKPVVLSSADDPNSKRQFQVEVTVTKVK